LSVKIHRLSYLSYKCLLLILYSVIQVSLPTLYLFFVFKLIHRYLRSTLFPYTTLFRSSLMVKGSFLRSSPIKATSAVSRADVARSEEHTSELQSRFDLVCRLLLEKKKK